MLLKIKKAAGEWYSFYATAIKNRLRRDLNLSDLSDISEARHNIELDGDNNETHFHDSRYIPLINDNKKIIEQNKKDIITEIEDRINADNNLRNLINTSGQQIQNNYEDIINDLYDEVQSRIEGDKQLLNLIDNIKVGSVNDLSDLNNRLDTEIRNRIKNDEEIQNKINQKFAVSITPPLPVDGGIWFDIGASLIKYWNGDKWIPFCAVYK